MSSIQKTYVSEKSIVVLPFVNMSSDEENEYFSDGITEEIINALTKVEGLKVIARTSSFSYKNKNIDVREIGEQLGVSTILEGSIRKAENRLRITAQLINSKDGIHIWSKNFDRELNDIFELQDEISLLIANRIRENFGHLNIQEHLVSQSTKSVKAYELFLKGRYYQLKWDADSIGKAIEYYDAAIAEDPQFARAYYSNLQTYGLLAAWGYMDAEEGFEKAISYFLKASEIDNQLPEYSLSLVGRSLWGEWNFQESYELILQTLQINPHYTDALEAMAELFIATGYFDDAERYVQKALIIDPISANHHYTLAYIYYVRRDYETAIYHITNSIKIDPELNLAKQLKLKCLVWLDRKNEFDTLVKSHDSEKLLNLLYQSVNNSQFQLTKDQVDEWENVNEDKSQLVPYELFTLANSSYKIEAMSLLKKYVDQKRGQIINYRQEPFLQKLHGIEEFHLLHQSNLERLVKPEKGALKVSERKMDSNEMKEQMLNLIGFIQEEHIYLDSLLSLNKLGEKFNIHPNKLSFLINEQSGKNFNEFINYYRLLHFKSIALEPKFAHLTILGLAFESGFNSKTVFNAFFKKKEGHTPAQWLKTVRISR